MQWLRRLHRTLRRALRHARLTQRLCVWTKDDARRAYYYDIRICPVRDGERYLVRFERTGMSTGNKLCWHRVMRRPEVRELQLRAC